MLFGHNSNVTVGANTFHVQTEDRGTVSAMIDTTVYSRGRVLHRRTKSYSDLLPLNADKEQAFVPGVFQQLVQNQNCVAWTDEALAEETDYRRWTMYGYAALGIFCIATAMILYGRWQMLQW